MVAFDYTQKSFWGGPWYAYYGLTIITILGGLFGLDHMWLRSPTTGIFKLLVNIFGLGIWYFYDLIQILGDKDNVMKYGLSAPIIGPLGIGAGMFTDNSPGEPVSKAPYLFMAYLALLWMPFGFDFFIAGDTFGALAKFICTFIIFLWPIAFIWGFINIGRAMFMPKSLFTHGTFRLFPVSMFMDSYGPTNLGPGSVSPEECAGGFTGYIGRIIQTAIGTAVGIVAPGLIPAVGAVTSAVTAVGTGVATTVPVVAESAQGVIRAAGQTTAAAVSTGADVLGAASSAQIPRSALLKLQKGGGGSGGSGDDFSSLALLVLFTILVGGGSLMAARRMGMYTNLFPEKKDASDTPPEPRRI